MWNRKNVCECDDETFNLILKNLKFQSWFIAFWEINKKFRNEFSPSRFLAFFWEHKKVELWKSFENLQGWRYFRARHLRIFEGILCEKRRQKLRKTRFFCKLPCKIQAYKWFDWTTLNLFKIKASKKFWKIMQTLKICKNR